MSKNTTKRKLSETKQDNKVHTDVRKIIHEKTNQDPISSRGDSDRNYFMKICKKGAYKQFNNKILSKPGIFFFMLKILY